MNRKVYAWSLVLALALAVLMGGCAAVRQEEAQKTDDLLAAAGFKVRPADTPEKLAHLKAMQPLKVSMRTKDGRVIYSYADPYSCICVYVGGPEEYAQYQRLLRQQVVEERLYAAEMANDEGADWGMWGPFWW
jgi:hypothetical protein